MNERNGPVLLAPGRSCFGLRKVGEAGKAGVAA
jgi:hypothetical protein